MSSFPSSHSILPLPFSPGLTHDEVCSVLTQVHNWIEFGKCLDIPVSDLKTIHRNQPSQVKEMVQKWLQNHPAPSWSLVQEALYQRGYYEPNLHQISKNAYLTIATSITIAMCICQLQLAIMTKFNWVLGSASSFSGSFPLFFFKSSTDTSIT